MSSIASLYIVKTGDLPAIVSAADSAHARQAVDQFGRELDEEYGWSGCTSANKATAQPDVGAGEPQGGPPLAVGVQPRVRPPGGVQRECGG